MGLRGFQEPHWTSWKIQEEGTICLRRENGQGPAAFHRSDFKVGRLSIAIYFKVLLSENHLYFIPI